MLEIRLCRKHLLLGPAFSFLVLVSVSHAQTVLLRAHGSQVPVISSIATFEGVVRATIVPVVPSPDLRVVLLLDSLATEDFPRLETELTALYKGLKPAPPFFLILDSFIFNSRPVASPRP